MFNTLPMMPAERCRNAEVIEVDVDKEDDEEGVREERRAKIWEDRMASVSSSDYPQGEIPLPDDSPMEEGEIPTPIIAEAQHLVLSLFELLSGYVAKYAPSTEAAGAPHDSSKTVASIMASQNWARSETMGDNLTWILRYLHYPCRGFPQTRQGSWRKRLPRLPRLLRNKQKQKLLGRKRRRKTVMAKEMGNDILSDQFRVLVTFYFAIGSLGVYLTITLKQMNSRHMYVAPQFYRRQEGATVFEIRIQLRFKFACFAHPTGRTAAQDFVGFVSMIM